MPKFDPNLNEASLVWENRSRIASLEAEFRHMTKTVENIDEKVDTIMVNHLPHLKELINKNKWQVGMIIGIAAVIGGAIIEAIFQKVL